MWRFLKRLALFALILLLVVLVGGGVWLRWRARVSLPLLDGTIAVGGLTAPVQVLRDAHGVPHIRAQSVADALFAQGYVTAQDRLWQMDLSRRKAEGKLSEVFGDRTLGTDIESRTMGLHLVAAKALAELSPDEQRLISAYARGVNAFINGHRDRLPFEFIVLRYQPSPWREIDSVSVALNLATALNQTWEGDLMREHVAAKLDQQLFADAFPDHSALDIPVAEVPASIRGEPKAADMRRGDEVASDALAGGVLDSIATETSAGAGSNNWVVSGSHTKSGKPLLANDPHISHSVPSVWYMNHLEAPALDVTGVSLPGLPLVIIGHNQHIAWGATNTGPDVQDLFIESFNFRDPNKYLHNGQWVDADIRSEVIKIRHQRDYRFTVKVTRHGPIISHAGNRDLALQWTMLGPRPVRLPFLRIDQATNWPEFTAALRDFSVPMQNFVYADTDGNIGFYAAGLVPIRKTGNGAAPVPGSTDDYDWTGYVPFDDLPHSYNPPSGIIATANGRIVPDSYPYFITARWEAPYRTARIFQLLRSGSQLTSADTLRIQADIHSEEDVWLAKQLLAAAEKQPASDPDAQFALGLLKQWDGEARADSAATLVLEVTRRALLIRILKPKLGADLSGYRWPMSTIFLQNVLEQNLTRWLPPGDKDFNATLMNSLEEGVKEIPELVHSHNRADWRWGDTIPLTFQHRLSAELPFLRRWLDVGPVPRRVLVQQ